MPPRRLTQHGKQAVMCQIRSRSNTVWSLLTHSLLELPQNGWCDKTWEPIIERSVHLSRIQNMLLICQIFYFHHLRKLKRVTQGRTTPQMSCLGRVARGFWAWTGWFSHTAVCAFCHLSGWCEIPTEEAWGTNKWPSVFLVSEISLPCSLPGVYESGPECRENEASWLTRGVVSLKSVT